MYKNNVATVLICLAGFVICYLVFILEFSNGGLRLKEVHVSYFKLFIGLLIPCVIIPMAFILKSNLWKPKKE